MIPFSYTLTDYYLGEGVIKKVINISNLQHNAMEIAKASNTRVCAVVKANAYGHGMKAALFLQPFVCGFAVANAAEAIELRQINVKKPILVLSEADSSQLDSIIGLSITPTVFSISALRQLNAAAERKNAVVGAHLKINTGMNRFGVSANDCAALLKEVQTLKNINISGVYTHFCSPDSDLMYTDMQFNRLLDVAKKAKCKCIHACASNFTLLNKKYYQSMIRAGLSLYGYDLSGRLNLKPALKVYGDIVNIIRVGAGEHIGYGNFVAQRDMTVAVVNGGYADGIRRGGFKHVSIDGVRCPIVGNICMDAVIVDIEGARAKLGSRAYFLGGAITAHDLATECGTIIYEILTSFNSSRGQIVYVK